MLRLYLLLLVILMISLSWPELGIQVICNGIFCIGNACSARDKIPRKPKPTYSPEQNTTKYLSFFRISIVVYLSKVTEKHKLEGAMFTIS
jgi:hypothetical protein